MGQDLPAWLEHLSDEDRAFIKRFVLTSGSLKQVAADYGISYPTVRLRLDRLIEKIRVVDDYTVSSAFEKALRIHFADGRIDSETFRSLLDAYKKETEK